MKNEKQQQAHNLYFQTNMSQSQISKLLDVDRKTIFNWIEEGNWRQLKKTAAHLPSKIVEQYYYMLANQNYEILSRGQQPYPLTHEAEAMRKVNICIKSLKNRQAVNESMEAFTWLAEDIEQKDPDFASKLRIYISDYISRRSKIKFAELVSGDMVPNLKMDEMFSHEIRPEDDDDPRYNEVINSLINATPPHQTPPDEDAEGGQPAPPPPDVTPLSPLERAGERSQSNIEETEEEPVEYQPLTLEPDYTPELREVPFAAEVNAVVSTPFSECLTTEAQARPDSVPTASSQAPLPAPSHSALDYTTPPSPLERAGERSTPPAISDRAGEKSPDDPDDASAVVLIPGPNVPKPKITPGKKRRLAAA